MILAHELFCRSELPLAINVFDILFLCVLCDLCDLYPNND